jgi:hypothetical protein
VAILAAGLLSVIFRVGNCEIKGDSPCLMVPLALGPGLIILGGAELTRSKRAEKDTSRVWALPPPVNPPIPILDVTSGPSPKGPGRKIGNGAAATP